jgi:hypothetical protein
MIELGAGITIGAGVTIGQTAALVTINYFVTEDDNQLISEDGFEFIEEN